ncbi:MAG: hypothetical protein ACREGD_02745 [Candidatus Saccharimonadales bacterium]
MPPGAAVLDQDPLQAQRMNLSPQAEMHVSPPAEHLDFAPPTPAVNLEQTPQTHHHIEHHHHDGCCADHGPSAESLAAEPILKQEEHRCGPDCQHNHRDHDHGHDHSLSHVETHRHHKVERKSHSHEDHHDHTCTPDCPEHQPTRGTIGRHEHPVGCDCSAHHAKESAPSAYEEAVSAAAKPAAQPELPPKQPLKTEAVPAAVQAREAEQQALATLRETALNSPAEEKSAATQSKQTSKPEPAAVQLKSRVPKDELLSSAPPVIPKVEQTESVAEPAQQQPELVLSVDIPAFEPEAAAVPAATEQDAELPLVVNAPETEPPAVVQHEELAANHTVEMPTVQTEAPLETAAPLAPEQTMPLAEAAVVAAVPRLEAQPAIARAVAEAVVAAPEQTREEARQLLADIESLSAVVAAADSPEAVLLTPVIQEKIAALSRLLKVEPSEMMRLLEIDPNRLAASVGTIDTLGQMQRLLHEDQHQRIKAFATANPLPASSTRKRRPLWDYVGDTVLNLAGRLRGRVAALAGY